MMQSRPIFTFVLTIGLSALCVAITVAQTTPDAPETPAPPPATETANSPAPNAPDAAGPSSEPDSDSTSAPQSPQPASPAAADEQEAASRQYLAQARDRLAAYRSIHADLRETVSIGARPFKAVGSYLQGRDGKLRVEFQVTIGDSLQGTLLQVCNGQLLWTRWNIGEESQITRRDIQEIQRALQQGPNFANAQLLSDLGLGGIKALLASIEENMQLDAAKEIEIDGTPFIVIHGTWNPELLEQMGIPRDAAEEPLPGYLPDSVRIYLQKDNLFPRRIMYLKRHPTEELVRPLVTLDFVNIQLNPTVDEADFEYEPPDDVPQIDDTKEFIDQIRRHRAANATRARAR